MYTHPTYRQSTISSYDLKRMYTTQKNVHKQKNFTYIYICEIFFVYFQIANYSYMYILKLSQVY